MPPKFGVPWPLHPDQALVEEAEEEDHSWDQYPPEMPGWRSKENQNKQFHIPVSSRAGGVEIYSRTTYLHYDHHV